MSRESREGRDEYAVSTGRDSEHGGRVVGDARAALPTWRALAHGWREETTSELELASQALAEELDGRASSKARASVPVQETSSVRSSSPQVEDQDLAG